MNLMLKDPSLLRTQAFVDGRWIDADGGIVRAECPGGYGALREPGAPREKAVR